MKKPKNKIVIMSTPSSIPNVFYERLLNGIKPLHETINEKLNELGFMEEYNGNIQKEE